MRPTLWAGRLDINMATRKKHTPEQVVRKLATADRMLNEGKDVADVCRELASPSTETIVMVVSFMVACPFSLGFVVVRFDRPAAPISSVAAESVRPIHSAPSPNPARTSAMSYS